MAKIFLITGASGSGKTTLCQAIAKTGEWVEVISHTTRPMRDGEVEGETYYFVTREAFGDGVKLGMFAERVEYDGNLYGVSKDEIDSKIKTGKSVFIIVENFGYRQIKEQYPEAIGIFIHMSKEHCLANMLLRGDSFDKAMDRSLLYKDEMADRVQYDYVIKNVHNKQIDTCNILRAIISQYADHYTINLQMQKRGLTPATPFTGGVVSTSVSSRLNEPVGY